MSNEEIKARSCRIERWFKPSCNFSKWENYKEINTTDKNMHWIIQKRVCTECGKVELRKAHASLYD